MKLTKTDIWGEIERLKAIAFNKAVAAHDDFLTSNYEWELGVEVYRTLTEDDCMYFGDAPSKSTLIGNKVRINYDDKEIIKLWKEVK